MCTNTPWETPHKHYRQISGEIRRKTACYDGIAWYATTLKVPADWKGREVYLYFGAVDESCWLYVNGNEVGARLHQKPNDWSTPFALRIDAAVDWSQPEQRIMVRVEDTSGQGGIWKPVWLLSR